MSQLRWQRGLATGDDRFTSSLAGGRGLVEVLTDPSAPNVIRYYRAQSDASFARYQRMEASQPFRWRVLQTDGSTMYFGDTAKAPGCPISDGFAPLTRHVDAFGNEIAYEYVYLYGECMLQRIAWGQNAPAGLAEFAEVKLQFKRAEVCPGTNIEVGSQRRYITAPPGWVTAPPNIAKSVLVVTGANKLDALEINALEPGSSTKVHTRLITLAYRGRRLHASKRPADSRADSPADLDPGKRMGYRCAAGRPAGEHVLVRTVDGVVGRPEPRIWAADPLEPNYRRSGKELRVGLPTNRRPLANRGGDVARHRWRWTA